MHYYFGISGFKDITVTPIIFVQAFGVGAFEDADEDIYATEDMSMYDFGDDKKESPEKTGTSSQTQQNKVSDSKQYYTLVFMLYKAHFSA